MTNTSKPLYSPEVHKVSGGWLAVCCDDRSHTVHEYGAVYARQWEAANAARLLVAAAYAAASDLRGER